MDNENWGKIALHCKANGISMSLIVDVFRILAAVIAPTTAIILLILSIRKIQGVQGEFPDEAQQCIQCGKSQPGDQGEFYYTEDITGGRRSAAVKYLKSKPLPILGSETHFVCDQCARRYIRNEILQTILLVLPYPLYLYVIPALFPKSGGFSSFLIEIVLVLLSFAGLTAAVDCHRAVGSSEKALDEVRDRVAIKARENDLNQKFSYYTRRGTTQLRK